MRRATDGPGWNEERHGVHSAWDDQDLRDRDRGGKSFGKGRTVHVAEADTEWYAEQIAHSISHDAAELEATWSYDLDEAIWWCGVLDPSIPEPDVMDWSEDWSYSESSPCAQCQALALISEDVSSPECVQQAEVLAAEANRTLAQARSAVASAKQNRRLEGKSKDSSCLICGRSDHFWRQCPERQSKGSGKGGENGSRTFYLGAAWSFDSKLFETVVLQADVVLVCGATETAGGVEAVQFLVDAVTQGFPDSRQVDSLDSPWFRFATGHWGRALSRVWLLTPLGWISIYTLEAENNHDTSFRRNEFLVYDAEGQARSVPLRRSPSGRRILNLLFLGQRSASCFSHATTGDFSEDPMEQNLNVSSACMFGLSSHPVSRFLSARKSCTCQLTPNVVHFCLDTVRFSCFLHEKRVPAFQSKVRSVRMWLSRLQTVIDGQESRRALDNMSKLHRSRLDTIFCTRRSGSSHFASDDTYSKPTRNVDQLREMCSSPTLRSSQAHYPDDVRLDTVIGISANECHF